MSDCGVGAVKGEAVEGSVGVAEEVDGVVESGFAALVDGFAEKENGAAIAGRLFAELIDGKGYSVEDRGAAVAFGEIGEVACGCIGVCGEGQDDVRSAVEGDDGDVVFDVADDGVKDGIEGAIVVQMAGAGPAGFDDDGESERLGVGVIFDGDFLRRTIVTECEVFDVEAENDVAIVTGDEDGDHDEVGTDGEFDLRGVGLRGGRWGSGLLGGCLRDAGGGERRQERKSEERAH